MFFKLELSLPCHRRYEKFTINNHLDNLKTVEVVWDTKFLNVFIKAFWKKGNDSETSEPGLTKKWHAHLHLTEKLWEEFETQTFSVRINE